MYSYLNLYDPETYLISSRSILIINLGGTSIRLRTYVKGGSMDLYLLMEEGLLITRLDNLI